MIGVVLGTGPSLVDVADDVRQLKADGKITLFGINNTYKDFDLDCWIACDPAWHKHYGQVNGDFEKWHWDKAICDQYGYKYIEGRWFDGLSTDPSWISLNHCSSAQALNLAMHYVCDKILLVGHDFRYEPGQPRHYFNDLSDVKGEYPDEIRKYSLFDKKGQGNDLLAVYRKIAEQDGLPPIINCTPGSALQWFPMGDFENYI